MSACSCNCSYFYLFWRDHIGLLPVLSSLTSGLLLTNSRQLVAMEPRSRRSIRQRSDRTLSRWVQERSRGHSHTFLLVRWLKGGQRGPLGLSIRTTLTISLYNKWTEAAGEQEEVWRMNPQCARCGKIVYPTEKVSCLDKVSTLFPDQRRSRIPQVFLSFIDW